MKDELLPRSVFIVVLANATDRYMIKYNPIVVNYNFLKSEIIRSMKMGLKLKHVVDLDTGEFLEQEVDKILGM